VDCAVCGVLQQMVYRDSITSLNDLKEKIRRCWAELSRGLIDRAVDQWRPRLQVVVKAKGGHIEHLFDLFLSMMVMSMLGAYLLRADLITMLLSIVFLNIFSTYV